MKIRLLTAGLVGWMALASGFPLHAASLYVYSINVPVLAYVYGPPYLSWSPAKIQANPNGWIPADQALFIYTDEQYHAGQSWYIQMFTDNTHVANAQTIFSVPDNNAFSGTMQGPLSPAYTGSQTITHFTTCVNQLPKSGLISADGRERVPLIWRAYDGLPVGYVPPAISEKAKPAGVLCDPSWDQCDFEDCSWAYFLDKGDSLVNAPTPGTAWQDGADYVVPMNINGTQTVITKRFEPTLVGGWNVGYVYVAANFRNATRQVFSTTLFVELVEL
jgi:hypothetical protein